MGNTLRILGIDISAWQGRPPPDWFREIRAAGYEAFIAQLWGGTPDGLGPSPHAAYQLQQATEAGFPVLGGYIYLPPDTTTYTTELVSLAQEAAGGARLHLVAIDIEADRLLHPTHPYARLVDCLSRVQAAWPDAQAVIYTRRNIWAVNLGVENPWPGGKPPVPLWEARYVLPSGQAPDAPPDLGWQWQPFGGWAERAGLQYAGTAPLYGVGADLNVFDLARLGIVGKGPGRPGAFRHPR